MYCGDGINDLVALASADVGMAVGASHASAAASVSDRHSSVAGKLSYSCTACSMSRSPHLHVRLACILTRPLQLHSASNVLNETDEDVPDSI